MPFSPQTTAFPPTARVDSAVGWAEIEQLQIEMPGMEIGTLVDLFKEETPGLIAQMTAAITTGNADGLRRAAHALKGCCANFGARPIEALCQTMETAARAGDMQGASERFGPICEELRRVTAALEWASHGGKR